MECVVKCGKPCTSGDSIDKITLDKCSKIQTNAKEWKGLDKFGDVWDTTNWEDGQQGRFTHNSCYITLCSLKKREQVIIRDAKAKEAAKEIPTSASHSRPPHYKKNMVINRIHSQKRSICMVHEKGGQETPKPSVQ